MTLSYVVTGTTNDQTWQETVEAFGYEVGEGKELRFFNLKKADYPLQKTSVCYVGHDGDQYDVKEYFLSIADGQWRRVRLLSGK